MNKIKSNIRLMAAFLAIGLMAGMDAGAVTAHAQSAEDIMPSQSQNGITFVSGGVGDGALDAIRAVRSQYNLHLLFAVQGSGQYLADVNVTIANGQGHTLVSATSDGPYFLAKLPPGHYRITAESGGRSQSKMVDIGAGHTAAASFYWPAGS